MSIVASPSNAESGDKNHDQSTQNETFSCVDAKFYLDAAEGKIDLFKNYDGSVDLPLTPAKNTALHIFITARRVSKDEFYRITFLRPIAFVDKILDIYPSILMKPNIKGETPLHLAARHGYDDAVKVLITRAKAQSQEDIERGIAMAQKMLRMTTVENETALHEAARLNHLQVVNTLITEDPEFMHPANKAGETPIFLAAERGYRGIVYMILKNSSSIQHQGPNGRTSLHAAVIGGDAEMTRKILEKEASLAQEVDQQGWTPLHHASYHGYLGIMEQLLQSYKTAAYIGDRDGIIPIHVAATRGKSHLEVIKLFLRECPDCCELVDNKYRNVLHHALAHESIWGLEDFLARVPFLSNLINEKNAQGNTPLHVLASNSIPCFPMIRHPLADKKAVNHNNFTALDTTLISENIGDNFKGRVIKEMNNVGFQAGGRKQVHVEGERTEEKEDAESAIAGGQSCLIVATLIATVTFAAGFTIPGGYHGDDHPDQQGTAILSRNTAFRAFIVTDTLALLFSILAVFLNFLTASIVTKNNVPRKAVTFFAYIFMFTMIAMVLMALAFTTGIYAVLPHSQSSLRIFLALIAALFPLICWWANYYLVKKNQDF